MYFHHCTGALHSVRWPKSSFSITKNREKLKKGEKHMKKGVYQNLGVTHKHVSSLGVAPNQSRTPFCVFLSFLCFFTCFFHLWLENILKCWNRWFSPVNGVQSIHSLVEIHKIYSTDRMLLLRHFYYCKNLKESRLVELAQPEQLFLMKFKIKVSQPKFNYNPSYLLLSTTREV